MRKFFQRVELSNLRTFRAENCIRPDCARALWAHNGMRGPPAHVADTFPRGKQAMGSAGGPTRDRVFALPYTHHPSTNPCMLSTRVGEEQSPPPTRALAGWAGLEQQTSDISCETCDETPFAMNYHGRICTGFGYQPFFY